MRAIREWVRKTTPHLRGRAADRGVTSIEYAGIVILVAGIILLITQLNLGTQIAAGIRGAVSGIL
ncbi:hypothetical protein RM572_19805 [Streptomyces sp. DSM 42041]|uniref:Flp family type IVb pilin n=1 Tax=Streptomyces hazeniae TaxID=3075538 RepID=A0ABU2NW91_9ACTN|nr:hypothetical protein [Streptomyces sp. DSM 42041]MDT0381004.1 hypothetical protein [Streptomyces sp. DSM 42041]